MELLELPLRHGGRLTAYLPGRYLPKEFTEQPRPAVIVCPGGAYGFLSEREGESIVAKFLSAGCNCFLLRYSVAPARFPTALTQLAEAVRLIRREHEGWNVDPQRVVVCGFSAAGHLACSLGTFWNRDFLWEEMGGQREEYRPDGLILCYPVISALDRPHEGSFRNLLGERYGEPELMELLSLERQVTAQMPPVFLWHTYEDRTVPVENALLLGLAIGRVGTGLEMHIYPHGPHALSNSLPFTARRPEEIVPEAAGWLDLAVRWIGQL